MEKDTFHVKIRCSPRITNERSKYVQIRLKNTSPEINFLEVNFFNIFKASDVAQYQRVNLKHRSIDKFQCRTEFSTYSFENYLTGFPLNLENLETWKNESTPGKPGNIMEL